jgi:hypothetical protein
MGSGEVEVRWCDACADHTAHEAQGLRLFSRLRSRFAGSPAERGSAAERTFDGACVRCAGRIRRTLRNQRRAWFDGRTIIDPF